jgi:RNA polymerase-binding protein DksA
VWNCLFRREACAILVEIEPAYWRRNLKKLDGAMSDYEDVKSQLEERLKTLGVKIDELKEDLRSVHSADWEEQATEAEGDEVLEALENTALSEVTAIRAALERIESGSYGECASCGEEINRKRLEALPYATLCISCAEKSGA